MTTTELSSLIRTIPNFPVPGIQFCYVTTLFQDAAWFQRADPDFVIAGTGIDGRWQAPARMAGFVQSPAPQGARTQRQRKRAGFPVGMEKWL